ncbi:MAG: germination protein YpeB [Selenomonadales bacterium]|nr:germination protein YpeB [Selenomonadales bacterium]
MHRRTFWVAIALLGSVAAGSVFWGLHQLGIRNRLQTRLENTYQRAFHELNFNMGAIEAELAKATVASTAEQTMIRLAAVWRQAYAAQEKMGQVPLGVAEFENTERFLARLGDAVLSVASTGVMPTAQERKMLDKLSRQARELSNSLLVLQSTVLAENVRFTDLELRTLGDRAPRDSAVLGQFRQVEEQVQQFPEVPMGDHVNIAVPPPLAVTVAPTPIATAEANARQFVRHIGADLRLQSQVTVTDAVVPHYSFVFAHPEDANRRVTVEVVRNGGRVFQMFAERATAAPVLPGAELQARADRFLYERGIANMKLLGVEEWGGSVIFTYCYAADGILFYPDLLRVRVAQDNGEILSFEGNGYVKYHRERGNFSEVVGIAAATAKLNETLEVIAGPQRVVLFDRRGVEVLCWEFTVQRRGGTEQFLVYINAVTGREENIVRLDAKPAIMPPAHAR